MLRLDRDRKPPAGVSDDALLPATRRLSVSHVDARTTNRAMADSSQRVDRVGRRRVDLQPQRSSCPVGESELRRLDETLRIVGDGLAGYGLPGRQKPERRAGHSYLLSGTQGERSVLVDGCAADPDLDARHRLPSLIHRPEVRAAPSQNHLVLPPPEFPTPSIGLVFQQTKDHDAPVRLNV